MSQPNQDQEVDLAIIGQKITQFFDSLGHRIFSGLLFIKKNVLIIIMLFIVGAVLGYFIDKNNNSYSSQIIVAPNFESTDDLYAKINLLKSRILEQDSVFLKQIGIQNHKKIGSIEIEPVVDIYNFVNNNATVANNGQNSQNFELVKLLAEDSDIKKVIKDDLTSKNYKYHKIKISSDGKVDDKKQIEPILNYLNHSEYFAAIQKQFVENVKIKIAQNQVSINQIDALLNQFAATTNNNKNDKLVYYNENNQLNEIIKNKDALINENGELQIKLINKKRVLTKVSISINEKNSKDLNGKMVTVLPIFFLFLFFGYSFLSSIYKNFSLKYS